MAAAASALALMSSQTCSAVGCRQRKHLCQAGQPMRRQEALCNLLRPHGRAARNTPLQRAACSEQLHHHASSGPLTLWRLRIAATLAGRLQPAFLRLPAQPQLHLQHPSAVPGHLTSWPSSQPAQLRSSTQRRMQPHASHLSKNSATCQPRARRCGNGWTSGAYRTASSRHCCSQPPAFSILC